MRKLLCMGLLVASSAGVSLRAKYILEAIASNDVEQVKKALARYEYLDHEYKKSLLKAAKHASEDARDKVSIFSSGTDVLKLLTGMGFAGTASVLGAVSGSTLLVPKARFVQEIFGSDVDRFVKKTEGASKAILAGSAVLGIAGLRLMYKGWTLSSARARLRKAREIEGMISFVPVRHHE
jgi:hypothetical protein